MNKQYHQDKLIIGLNMYLKINSLLYVLLLFLAAIHTRIDKIILQWTSLYRLIKGNTCCVFILHVVIIIKFTPPLETTPWMTLGRHWLVTIVNNSVGLILILYTLNLKMDKIQLIAQNVKSFFIFPNCCTLIRGKNTWLPLLSILQ